MPGKTIFCSWRSSRRPTRAAIRREVTPLPRPSGSYAPLRNTRGRVGDRYRLPVPGAPEPLRLDSPALEVMTDLRRVSAVTTDGNTSIANANQTMIARGVRALFVVDDTRRILGILTSSDLLGERPIQLAQARGIHYDEVAARDIMTPAERLEVVDLRDVQHARVGNIIATLRLASRQHALVVEDVEGGGATGDRTVCGIFSLTQIGRRLGIPPQPGSRHRPHFRRDRSADRVGLTCLRSRFPTDAVPGIALAWHSKSSSSRLPRSTAVLFLLVLFEPSLGYHLQAPTPAPASDAFCRMLAANTAIRAARRRCGRRPHRRRCILRSRTRGDRRGAEKHSHRGLHLPSERRRRSLPRCARRTCRGRRRRAHHRRCDRELSDSRPVFRAVARCGWLRSRGISRSAGTRSSASTTGPTARSSSSTARSDSSEAPALRHTGSAASMASDPGAIPCSA